MPEAALVIATGSRLVQYGPGQQFLSNNVGALANNGAVGIGIASAGRVAHLYLLSVRSSVAGFLEIEDGAAVAFRAVAVAANTWVDVPLGGLGVLNPIVAGDFQIRNRTGAASNIDWRCSFNLA